MRFLCTNDDGILAHGLDCLVRAAEQIGEVTVVAPDRFRARAMSLSWLLVTVVGPQRGFCGIVCVTVTGTSKPERSRLASTSTLPPAGATGPVTC